MTKTLVFEKNANFFAENRQQSQKIVIITSTPDCFGWSLRRTKVHFGVGGWVDVTRNPRQSRPNPGLRRGRFYKTAWSKIYRHNLIWSNSTNIQMCKAFKCLKIKDYYSNDFYTWVLVWKCLQNLRMNIYIY
jgi:hypothetical protein